MNPSTNDAPDSMIGFERRGYRLGVTAKDIARAAGVGRSTVQRALSNKGEISPETKARILKIAEELKYRPNHIARSLVLGQSRFVGVVATPSFMPEFPSTLQPVEFGLRQAGYSMLFFTSTGYPGGERLCLEQMLQNRVAGVIAVPSSNPADRSAYQELIDSDIKLVIMGGCIEGLEVPQVLGNDYQAARLATEHLISLGHREIVYLAIPQTSYSGRERARGFKEAMADAGLPVRPSSIVEVKFGQEAGAEAMARILKRKNRPTALVVRHDIVAVGAVRAIFAAGLSVPEGFSVVGNTDVWFDDMLRVPLTSVRHPREQMAEFATKNLLAMLAKKPVEAKTTILDVDLVVRSSTAPPAKM
ncbi:MAG: LacI family DNA-binding transcriptional regulator [Armatimonadetes bacterium]|nr:LacI family DNA-binding transcriptional regulator [Armatimonadota bacterium]